MSCDALAQPEPSKPTELTWFVVLVIYLFNCSLLHSFIFTLALFFLLFSSDALFLIPPLHIHALLFSYLLFPIFVLSFLALDLPPPHSPINAPTHLTPHLLPTFFSHVTCFPATRRMLWHLWPLTLSLWACPHRRGEGQEVGVMRRVERARPNLSACTSPTSPSASETPICGRCLGYETVDILHMSLDDNTFLGCCKF